MELEQLNAKYGVKDALTFFAGEGGLPMVRVTTPKAEALVSVHGGQVLSFRPKGAKADILFLSDKAYYAPEKAIKGGVPICWPWFGADPESKGRPGHGFVRNSLWDVRGSRRYDDGRIKLTLGLKDTKLTLGLWPHPFDLELEITIGAVLELELTTRNTGTQLMHITQGLHSYFHVGDIAQTEIHGLDGTVYLDKLDGSSEKSQSGALTIGEEVDRIYLDVGQELAIDDKALRRRILIESSGSKSAVVWNPWQDVAAKMADLPDDAYRQLVCVETVNAGPDQAEIRPGRSHTIRAEISLA